MNEVLVTNTQPAKPPIAMGRRGLELTTLEDMYRFAQYVSASGMAPKGMNQPETILVALEMGQEVGLKPMQALQNIAVINGRPGIYGDAAKALVLASGLAEYIVEAPFGKGDEYGWSCKTKRVGMPEEETRFTITDAKRAKLWGKSGPWQEYPQRMLMFRARGFRLRDTYPDVLRGVHTVEELHDMPQEPPMAKVHALAATFGEPAPLPDLPAIEHDWIDPLAPDDESTLTPDAQETSQDAAMEEAKLVDEYLSVIADASTDKKLGAFWRQAADDARLTPQSKNQIGEAFNRKQKELRKGKDLLS